MNFVRILLGKPKWGFQGATPLAWPDGREVLRKTKLIGRLRLSHHWPRGLILGQVVLLAPSGMRPWNLGNCPVRSHNPFHGLPLCRRGYSPTFFVGGELVGSNPPVAQVYVTVESEKVLGSLA